MHPKELIAFIEQGESSHLEFKRKVVNPRKIAREISAFANTKGGTILIGVDDNRTVCGVASEKSESAIVQQACDFYILPPVKAFFENVSVFGFEVVVVKILESKQKPHYVMLEDKETGKEYKRAYIRVGEKSVIASREMSRLMNYQNPDAEPLKLIIGEHEKRLFAYLEKYERVTVRDFAKIANISRRRAERLLIRLVRAGTIQINSDETSADFFTLVPQI